MRVDLSATLHPGVAAVEIVFFATTPLTAETADVLDQYGYLSHSQNALYLSYEPYGRHTTAEIAGWPVYNGVDYSWDQSNKHMLGVFGIDIYDNFQGAYQFDRNYGIFRYADRRIVQGMKLWTFGYGEGANFKQGYTDNAGPYVELQSGRHVWDGHYEWVAPRSVESWTEWWIPVSDTGGLTTLTRDVALNLEVNPDPKEVNSTVTLALSATHVVSNANLVIRAKCGELLNTPINLDPAKSYHKIVTGIKAGADVFTDFVVTLTGKEGDILLDYHRPGDNPGGKEYTAFTKP